MNKGSDAVVIFMLKNAAPDEYGEKQTLEVKGDTLSILGSLTPETRNAIARDLQSKHN